MSPKRPFAKPSSLFVPRLPYLKADSFGLIFPRYDTSVSEISVTIRKQLREMEFHL